MEEFCFVPIMFDFFTYFLTATSAEILREIKVPLSSVGLARAGPNRTFALFQIQEEHLNHCLVLGHAQTWEGQGSTPKQGFLRGPYKGSYCELPPCLV